MERNGLKMSTELHMLVLENALRIQILFKATSMNSGSSRLKYITRRDTDRGMPLIHYLKVKNKSIQRRNGIQTNDLKLLKIKEHNHKQTSLHYTQKACQGGVQLFNKWKTMIPLKLNQHTFFKKTNLLRRTTFTVSIYWIQTDNAKSEMTLSQSTNNLYPKSFPIILFFSSR